MSGALEIRLGVQEPLRMTAL